MDTQEIRALVAGSQFAMSILSDGRGEYALAHLGTDTDSTEAQADLITRGYVFFVGVMGVSPDGTARAGLASPLDDETISQLGAAFLTQFERVMELVEKDGADVMALEALLRLPDTRD